MKFRHTYPLACHCCYIVTPNYYFFSRYVIEYQDENHSTHLPHTIVSAADTGGETGIAPGTLEYYAPLVHSETGDVTVQQESAESAASLVTMTPDGANIGDATQPYLTIDPSMLITRYDPEKDLIAHTRVKSIVSLSRL